MGEGSSGRPRSTEKAGRKLARARPRFDTLRPSRARWLFRQDRCKSGWNWLTCVPNPPRRGVIQGFGWCLAPLGAGTVIARCTRVFPVKTQSCGRTQDQTVELVQRAELDGELALAALGALRVTGSRRRRSAIDSCSSSRTRSRLVVLDAQQRRLAAALGCTSFSASRTLSFLAAIWFAQVTCCAASAPAGRAHGPCRYRRPSASAAPAR